MSPTSQKDIGGWSKVPVMQIFLEGEMCGRRKCKLTEYFRRFKHELSLILPITRLAKYPRVIQLALQAVQNPWAYSAYRARKSTKRVPDSAAVAVKAAADKRASEWKIALNRIILIIWCDDGNQNQRLTVANAIVIFTSCRRN